MNNKIKVFEKTENGWKEGLDFGYTVLGKQFTTKTICFSPINCNLADLRVMVENKDDFIFTKSEDHIYPSKWTKILPFKINEGSLSEPIKLEFLIKSGPIRIDSIQLSFEYLEIPNEG